MKIKKSNAGLLSNFEVLDLLRSRGATQDPLGSLGAATASECKVFAYLLQSAACNQTRECIQEFVEKIKKFELTKAEKLQTLNLRPSTAVEVHLIVEDCEERMSSDAVDAFIGIVKNTLPSPPQKPQEDVVEDDETMEGNGEGTADGMEE
eukprot:TRINITY_DN2946_c0_g2_i1.p1 TRINITY_DN2946_c0_g2~~TRINITY_DN2946_c0_g2_i1.p1  ORF type:complete len:150 (-),score=41.25 TRINITY_DN2946_c0_g2_i1:439-888(-)